MLCVQQQYYCIDLLKFKIFLIIQKNFFNIKEQKTHYMYFVVQQCAYAQLLLFVNLNLAGDCIHLLSYLSLYLC